jgi:hypothetical protein
MRPASLEQRQKHEQGQHGHDRSRSSRDDAAGNRGRRGGGGDPETGESVVKLIPNKRTKIQHEPYV